MANTHITVNQYEELLKRIEKVEHRDTAVDELKEEYHNIKKDAAVTDTKIDSFRIEFRTEIKSVRTEIKSLEKRFTMLWALQIMTFLAILGLYFKIFNVI